MREKILNPCHVVIFFKYYFLMLLFNVARGRRKHIFTVTLKSEEITKVFTICKACARGKCHLKCFKAKNKEKQKQKNIPLTLGDLKIFKTNFNLTPFCQLFFQVYKSKVSKKYSSLRSL